MFEQAQQQDHATLKDRLAELIGNINQCQTKEGVDELEKLYIGKKKELGKEITPMQDIMVRDSIKGRRDQIKDMMMQSKEERDAKTKSAKDSKLAAKMDESIRVFDYLPYMHSDLITETEGNSAVISFGRMNPPTVGHRKLMDKMVAVAKKKNADAILYLSHTQDAKKNPLPYKDKLNFARKLAPAGLEVRESNLKNLFQIVESLPAEGYTDVTVVVGSDRINEFKRAGVYFLKKGGENFDIVSAGERDPDAEGVEGMSASKMRAAVASGDIQAFKSGTGLSDKDSMDLFRAVERGMGL